MSNTNLNSKIDFIVTWVDGNDPAWQEERSFYAKKEQKDSNNDNCRFRDWGLLRYWFRGVEKFAPWVNKIYFVTCGHLPQWLNIENPKLVIVNHSEFIPKEFLPTYNSFTIEFYLHRIPCLSEQIVYFNDDMFLTDFIKPDRFFYKKLPCDIGGMTINIHSGMFGASVLLAKTRINEHFNKKQVILRYPLKWFNTSYLKSSIRNLICLFIKKDEFVGFLNPHLPQPYLLSLYKEVCSKVKQDIFRTSRNRFRYYGDLCIWVIRYWQLASNNFSPYNVFRDGQYYLLDDNNYTKIAKIIRQKKKKMICINDGENITKFKEAKQCFIEAFEEILPEKSTFEK